MIEFLRRRQNFKRSILDSKIVMRTKPVAIFSRKDSNLNMPRHLQRKASQQLMKKKQKYNSPSPGQSSKSSFHSNMTPEESLEIDSPTNAIEKAQLDRDIQEFI